MLQEYKNQLPDYAKDLKLNLSHVLDDSADTSLNATQRAGLALASAYATKNVDLIRVMGAYAKEKLEDAYINATKAAASIMGMNNIYYRAIHLIEDQEYQKMPAQLRMNFMANPGIEKADFELLALAVSAINGCGFCVSAHAKILSKAGVSKASIQHALRIAAVINGLAQVATIEA